MTCANYHIPPDEALHLLGWRKKRHASLPVSLLWRMGQYAQFQQAHEGYEQTLGHKDGEATRAAEKRFNEHCTMAADYVRLMKTADGMRWIREYQEAHEDAGS